METPLRRALARPKRVSVKFAFKYTYLYVLEEVGDAPEYAAFVMLLLVEMLVVHVVVVQRFDRLFRSGLRFGFVRSCWRRLGGAEPVERRPREWQQRLEGERQQWGCRCGGRG